MIVDTSAIVAIVFREPGFEVLVDKLAASPSTGVGTPTLAEAGMVLSSRLRRDAMGSMARLIEELQLVEVPFGEPHWREAVRAHARFGRGHHRAGLNLGDCMSYAVARLAQEPLLFVGGDFAATDIEAA